MRFFLYTSALLLFLVQAANAFEIKPLNIFRGANSRLVNTSKIKFKGDNKDCKGEHYYSRTNGGPQPVHEAITRIAYNDYFKKDITDSVKSWEHPLLSGAIWNDDPEQLIRKVVFVNKSIPNPKRGMDQIKSFRRLATEHQSPTNALTTRSHVTDLQFLHAMRPKMKKGTLNSVETAEEIMNWLELIYPIATNKIPWDQKLSTYGDGAFCRGGRYEFFKECSNKIVFDIFDRKSMWRSSNRDHQFDVRQLASGSILHLIQDSFTKSHTLREGGKLACYYTYDEENMKDHCLSDTAMEATRESIDQAIRKSIEFMPYWHKRVSWKEVKSFFEEIFLPLDIKKCDHRTSVTQGP